MVSPRRAITAPPACLAMRPDSRMISRPSGRGMETDLAWERIPMMDLHTAHPHEWRTRAGDANVGGDCALAAQVQLFNQGAIALNVGPGQIVQQTATLGDHGGQSAAGMLVHLVDL